MSYKLQVKYYSRFHYKIPPTLYSNSLEQKDILLEEIENCIYHLVEHSGITVEDLYSEQFINISSKKLNALQYASNTIDEKLKELGINSI